MTGEGVEGLLREQAPQVLGALVRRYGHFDTAEDAVQEALIAAATQWPADGIPDNPRAWLITRCWLTTQCPRISCASSRRRSSVRWCAGTGTSTRPRTRCRRR